MRAHIQTLFFALLAQIGYAQADPFEVHGYRQGMSLKQIKELAKRHGQTVHHDNYNDSDLNLVRVSILQGDRALLNLALCNDRVFNAFWLVGGGLDRFVKQLDSLAEQGLEKSDVGWHSSLSQDGTESFNLSVYFINPKSDEYYVTATLFASETYGTTNYQVSWSALADYCKKHSSG